MKKQTGKNTKATAILSFANGDDSYTGRGIGGEKEMSHITQWVSRTPKKEQLKKISEASKRYFAIARVRKKIKKREKEWQP